MLLSNTVKFSIFFAVSFCLSCGMRQASENDNSTPFISGGIERQIPFATKEPERFQTEIVITNFPGGEKTEKKYFLARNGAKRLIVFDFGEPSESSILQTADGKTFLINKKEKSFRESSAQMKESGGELGEFLTTLWLNQKTDAAFENLGTENDLTKYLVRLGNSKTSEILVFVDEINKMPVKQDFYSLADGQKTLMYRVQLQNFLTSADENLFDLPQNYERAETK